MSNQLVLEKRSVQGKKLKALRQASQVPSVVYGKSDPILAISPYNNTEKALLEAGYHSPLELIIDGKNQLAIVKHIAIDPVSRRLVNVEFQAIDADEVVEATTPLEFAGFDESAAAKLHYVLSPVIEEVEIKAKPTSLPEKITVDASKLASTEDKLTLADLDLPAGVELANKELELDAVVANVYDPATEAAAREEGETSAEEGTESSEAVEKSA